MIQNAVQGMGKPVSPPALREEELTAADVELLLRVAADKNAAAGRYKRTPKRIPTAAPISCLR